MLALMTHRTEHGTETLNYVYVSLIFFRLYSVQGHLWFKSIRTHAGRFAIAAIESVSDNTAVIRSLGAIDPVIILSFSVLAKSQCGRCVVLTSIPAQLRFASNYNALINLLPAPGIDYVQLSTHSKYTQHESSMTLVAGVVLYETIDRTAGSASMPSTIPALSL